MRSTEGKGYVKEDIFWKNFVLKYVSYLKYFQFYLNMLGRRGISLLAFFPSNIHLTPIANLSSNSVSPSFQMSLTSGPQLPQKCHQHIPCGSLQQPPNWSTTFIPLLSTTADWISQTLLPSKFFPAEKSHMDPQYPYSEVWISQSAGLSLCYSFPTFWSYIPANSYSNSSLPFPAAKVASSMSALPGHFSNPSPLWFSLWF